jgi:N-formylglutamate deformylase
MGDVRSIEVVRPPDGGTLPLIGHVPHAGTVIPSEVRAGLVLDDAGLEAEIVAMTDWHTDRLAVEPVLSAGGVAIVNRLSRLVVDPERLPEDPMLAHGMGAIYTRTSGGVPLRTAADPLLLERYFQPWARAVEGLVDDALQENPVCLILDVHSFPSRPLPYENAALRRPAICLGADDVHTPRGLVDELAAVCRTAGAEVAVNEPFAGAYVPLRHFGRDERVQAVMLEVNRGCYLDESTGAPSDGWADTAELVAHLVATAASHVATRSGVP